MKAATRVPNSQALEAAIASEEADFSVTALMGIVWRRRTLVASTALLVILGSLVTQLRKPLTYTASTSFRTQTRPGSAGVAGLATQLGFPVGAGADQGDSPAFYVELVHSRPVLGELATATFEVVRGRTSSLADVLGVRIQDPVRRRDYLIKQMRGAVGASVSPRTGLVTISVTLENALVAQQVARYVLDALNRFNLDGRNSQAATQRVFVERRLSEVGAELRQTEDQLTAFLQQNRDYTRSPQLLVEQQRLARAVDIKQRVYAILAQSYEEAKINEVRNTPAITVIEPPEVPLDPNSRGRLKGILFGALGGLMLGIMLALVRERFAGVTRDDLLGRGGVRASPEA